MSAEQRRQAASSRRDMSSPASPKRYASDNGVSRCDPSAIVDKFEQVTNAPDRFRTQLPELDLPGFGDPYDDCGGDFALTCTNCGAVTETDRTCYRSQCPECAAWWAFRQSRKAASKLEATLLVKEANGGEGWSGWKFHHLALSPLTAIALIPMTRSSSPLISIRKYCSIKMAESLTGNTTFACM